MAPIVSTLWDASTQFFRTSNLQVPLQGPRSNLPGLHVSQDAVHHPTSPAAGDAGSFRGGPQIAGVDLVAMLVSDSGLASTEPVWWNTSPMGCLLLGLQPRGGWQVMQRSVQWGHDRLTKAFGVSCTKPILFAYFTCSIRNRIEVWNSPRWKSPMQNHEESGVWACTGRSFVSRPTKLIDGSRGGQAFMCEMLRPRDGEHYGIEQQARMQFLSVLLVAVGLMEDQSLENFKSALAEDFGITVHLSSVFKRLFICIVIANTVLMLAFCSIGYHFWGRNIFGPGTAYMVEITSIASWATGAIGLLMQGGNPRAVLADLALPLHIQERLEALIRGSELGVVEEITSAVSPPADEKKVMDITEAINPSRTTSTSGSQLSLHFGSLHGSVFLRDKGHCSISSETVRFLCNSTLRLQRPWQWYTSVLWCGLLLVASIVLQVVGTHTATTGSVVVGVFILLTTSVLRGSGISGPEEWQIPVWKRRRGTNYGAPLQGALSAR